MGSVCEVACKESGQSVVGQSVVACLGTLHWSPLPLCTCSEPDLRGSEGLRPAKKEASGCRNAAPGQTCELECGGRQQRIHGNPVVRCLPNATWSSPLPKCVPRLCSELRTPKYLEKRSCSGRHVGDTCTVACRERGAQLVGGAILVCLNETHWSEVPACTCPRPSLRSGLRLGPAECGGVLPGGRCHLRCEEEYARIVGEEYIVCGNDSRWTAQPKCEAKLCPKPDLRPATLRFDDGSKDCSAKKPGDTCLLTCSTGTLLGVNPITCLAGLSWTDLPACACPPPHLGAELRAAEGCDTKLPGQTCRVACRSPVRVPSAPGLTCSNESRWSEPPTCRAVACEWPAKLKPNVVPDGDCTSKRPGEKCPVSCAHGGELLGDPWIRCDESKAWTTSPACGCSAPVLGEGLKSSNASCGKTPVGRRCQLRCDDAAKKMVGRPHIECLPNLRWTSQPSCRTPTCADPSIPEKTLETVGGACRGKKVGEACRLRCTAGGEIRGEDSILCLNETHWSPLPECSCPPPELRDDLRANATCRALRPGAKCPLACRQRGEVLAGSGSITCLKGGQWSPQPPCRARNCAPLKLPEKVLEAAGGACADKKVGEACRLRCSAGGRLLGGSDTVRCLNETHWSELPDCACPAPVLRASLDTKADCSATRRGGSCALFCRHDKKMTGNATIVCRNDTEWSPQPTCEEQLCPEPQVPPYLRAVRSCAAKTVGEDCELTCSQGGKIVGGQKNIVCQRDLSWTPHPTCTCPTPTESTGLRVGNCTEVRPGQSCRLSCLDGSAMPDTDTLTCGRESAAWTQEIPACKKKRCRSLTLVHPSVYRGTCERKSAGDVCQLRCIGSGTFLGGDGHIRCLRNGTWTRPRKCVCPAPPDRSEYLPAGPECATRSANETCPVTCRNGFDSRTQKFIRCSPFYRWENYPPCEPESCPTLVLPKHLRVVEGNCNRMTAKSSCRLACERGVMQGPDVVRCDEFQRLSRVPRCVCPRPSFPAGTATRELCEGKPEGARCWYHCLVEPDNQLLVQCKEDLTWTAFPQCPCSRPKNLNEGVFLTGDCARLQVFRVNLSCEVRCPPPSWMTGGRFMVCMPGNKWSPSPNCVCPPVEPPPPLFDMQLCQRVRARGACQIACVSGAVPRGRMDGRCNADYTWNLPTSDGRGGCVALPRHCPDAKGPLSKVFVEVLGACAVKRAEDLVPGTTCPVRCFNGADYITRQRIQCLPNMTWDAFPLCACPPLHVQFPYALTEDCSRMFKDHRCRLSLSDRKFQFAPGVSGAVTCLGHTGQWAALPAIVSQEPVCLPPANLDPLVRFLGQNCRMMRPGEYCDLSCLGGGHFVGANTPVVRAQCMPNLQWNGVPKCTCAGLRTHSNFICQSIEYRAFCREPCGGTSFKYRQCLPSGQMSDPPCIG